MRPSSALHVIKVLHTFIWAVLAGCILAIPVFTYTGNLQVAGTLVAVVMIEVLIIAVNGGRCPLTDIAARYTKDQNANFDIYLPVWLARNNKLIFGTLFITGGLYTLFEWLGRRGVS